MLLHYIPSPAYMVHVINVQKRLAHIAMFLSTYYLHLSYSSLILKHKIQLPVFKRSQM